MHVKIFMNTANHNSEREVLRKMFNGINSKYPRETLDQIKEKKRFNKKIGRGYGVDIDYSESYMSCDLAVMLGSWKPSRDNLHHILRYDIVQKSKSFMCLETPLLGRKVFQENEYYRIGINGFLNRDALWGTEDDKPSDRFELLGLKYNGWKTDKKEKIVIALQLAGDASLRNQNINEWCLDSIKKIRQFSDRPIEIRTHPGLSDKGWSNHEQLFRELAFLGLKDVKCVNGRTLPWQKHLEEAYCVVSYTSGLSIDAILNGTPVIACDEGNFAWNVSETNLENIENLFLEKEENIQQWLYNLAYCQWNPNEMQSGKVWDYLSSIVELAIEEKENANS